MQETAPRRRFAQIAEELGRRIRSGEYAVGDRLPSERLLIQEFAVSRPTIREALFALELAGHVEARAGSGVYVRESPAKLSERDSDMGPFEMLEARRAIEGEACALAATRISAEQLLELEQLVGEIREDVDVVQAELADRRFHEAIGAATQNQAMASAVEMLWEARARSMECQLMSVKARAAGVKPIMEEHRAILDAIKSGSADDARSAMHRHLTRVLESVMAATEVEEIEQVRARVAAQRMKFSSLQ